MRSYLKLLYSALVLASLALVATFPALAHHAVLHRPHSQDPSSPSASSHSISLPGLEQPVQVLIDQWGVPHIYAQNQHDLFFAQGFVTARDRLFQMELWKRAGQGRLAEVVGPSVLPRDIAARLVRYRGSMRAEYLSYAPDTREILAAYTDGINAYIRIITASGGPGLPTEFKLAHFSPEPWKPEDCLTRMATLSVTGNAMAEMAFSQLVDELGVRKANALVHFDPATRLEPAPGENLSDFSTQLIEGFVGTDAHIAFPPDIQGSNNWTISGKLTRSGLPLLANDPHRTIALPSLRYIIHLVAPGWDVIGSSEIAIPGVSIGHNQNIAWGLTVFPVDQQDLFLEQLDPKNDLLYRRPSGWAKMRVIDETFQIRGAKPVTIPLKFTRHGPVLWSAGTRALALCWVGAEPGTAPYLAGLSVDRARDWPEYLRAMERWKTPPENLVYADRRGNIGVQSAGLTPIRPRSNGLLPVPGAGGYEWTGFVPLSELPRQFDPARGFIATANNKTTPPHYPYAVGFLWSTDRIARIEQVLGAARKRKQKLTVQDMAALQNDVVSLPAQQMMKLLAAVPSNDAAARFLHGWDGAVTIDSGPAALYEVWTLQLRGSLVSMLLPGQPHASLPLYGDRIVQLLAHPPALLFGPRPVARREQIFRETLDAAYSRMQQLEGNDSSTWSWGRLHKVRFHHSLDELPGVASLLDLGPVPRPGDGTTVDATPFRPANFEQAAGASYREIFDLSDWDNSEAIDAPGESGRPESPHYGDLLSLWRDGKYFPLAYSRQAVEKVTTERLELVPAAH